MRGGRRRRRWRRRWRRRSAIFDKLNSARAERDKSRVFRNKVHAAPFLPHRVVQVHEDSSAVRVRRRDEVVPVGVRADAVVVVRTAPFVEDELASGGVADDLCRSGDLKTSKLFC